MAPAPSAITPAAATTAPAPTTTRPAPNTTHPAPATKAPAPKATMLAPKAAMDTAADVPYSDKVGRVVEMTLIAAAAKSAPAPTRTTAAPKAINPTELAVRAGPTAAAPAANATTATTIPAIQAIAGVPAFASAILDAAIIARPAATRTTAVPNASNAVAPACALFGVCEKAFIAAIPPIVRATKAPVIPTITPIAAPPEFASAILDAASIPKPAAIVNTPTPSIIVLFAIVSIALLLTFAEFPAAVSPAATPNNFAANPPMPFPNKDNMAFEKLLTPGASVFTTLNAL